MLMEHFFYETTIGDKWNVCGMTNEYPTPITWSRITYLLLTMNNTTETIELLQYYKK